MNTIIDVLAETIRDSVNEAGTTRLEWERALSLAYDPAEQAEAEPLAGSGSVDHQLRWAIDYPGASPAEAAARVWREVFSRGPAQPGPEEACVFEVLVENSLVRIDLSETAYAHLFTVPGSGTRS